MPESLQISNNTPISESLDVKGLLGRIHQKLRDIQGDVSIDELTEITHCFLLAWRLAIAQKTDQSSDFPTELDSPEAMIEELSYSILCIFCDYVYHMQSSCVQMHRFYLESTGGDESEVPQIGAAIAPKKLTKSLGSKQVEEILLIFINCRQKIQQGHFLSIAHFAEVLVARTLLSVAMGGIQHWRTPGGSYVPEVPAMSIPTDTSYTLDGDFLDSLVSSADTLYQIDNPLGSIQRFVAKYTGKELVISERMDICKEFFHLWIFLFQCAAGKHQGQIQIKLGNYLDFSRAMEAIYRLLCSGDSSWMIEMLKDFQLEWLDIADGNGLDGSRQITEDPNPLSLEKIRAGRQTLMRMLRDLNRDIGDKDRRDTYIIQFIWLLMQSKNWLSQGDGCDVGEILGKYGFKDANSISIGETLINFTQGTNIHGFRRLVQKLKGFYRVD